MHINKYCFAYELTKPPYHSTFADASDCGQNPGRPKGMCHIPDIANNCPSMCGSEFNSICLFYSTFFVSRQKCKELRNHMTHIFVMICGLAKFTSSWLLLRTAKYFNSYVYDEICSFWFNFQVKPLHLRIAATITNITPLMAPHEFNVSPRTHSSDWLIPVVFFLSL